MHEQGFVDLINPAGLNDVVHGAAGPETEEFDMHLLAKLEPSV